MEGPQLWSKTVIGRKQRYLPCAPARGGRSDRIGSRRSSPIRRRDPDCTGKSHRRHSKRRARVSHRHPAIPCGRRRHAPGSVPDPAPATPAHQGATRTDDSHGGCIRQTQERLPRRWPACSKRQAQCDRLNAAGSKRKTHCERPNALCNNACSPRSSRHR